MQRGAPTFVDLGAPPITNSAIVECLAGQRVFIGGNSVARHWAFVLADLLDNRTLVQLSPSCGEHSWVHKDHDGLAGAACLMKTRPAADRETEKRICGKGTFGRPDDMLACRFRSGKNTSITFGFERRVNASAMQRDWSTLSPHVAVLQAGSDDILDPARAPTWLSTQEREAPALARMLKGLRTEQQPTPTLYWRTSTPLCPEKCNENSARPAYGKCNETVSKNAQLLESNKLLLGALCTAADTPLACNHDLHIVDTWAWNLERCSLYDDYIHHSVLARTHVYSFLAHYCGGHQREPRATQSRAARASLRVRAASR